MTWAGQRRLAIGLIIGAILFVVLSLIAITAFYRSPSCSDGKLNQDELGIDCGGGCELVCVADAIPPTTLFTTLLRNKDGRTDLVASVENRNGDLAAEDVPYKVTVYSASGTVLKEFEGVLDMPPHTAVPIFVPGVALAGQQVPDRAFLSIDSTRPRWVTVGNDPRVIPLVDVQPLSGSIEAPRLSAVLTNPSLTNMSRVPVIALIHDSRTGNVIAASQTIVPVIAPQGSATALFTWNEPFSNSSVRVEVVPVIPLP